MKNVETEFNFNLDNNAQPIMNHTEFCNYLITKHDIKTPCSVSCAKRDSKISYRTIIQFTHEKRIGVDVTNCVLCGDTYSITHNTSTSLTEDYKSVCTYHKI